VSAFREWLRYWFGTAKCLGCDGRVRIVNGSRVAAYCTPCIDKEAWR
jgi:hypothetical protein